MSEITDSTCIVDGKNLNADRKDTVEFDLSDTGNVVIVNGEINKKYAIAIAKVLGVTCEDLK